MGKVDPRRPPGVQARVLAKRRINAERTKEQEKIRSRKLLIRATKVNQKLSELGIKVPKLEILRKKSASTEKRKKNFVKKVSKVLRC